MDADRDTVQIKAGQLPVSRRAEISATINTERKEVAQNSVVRVIDRVSKGSRRHDGIDYGDYIEQITYLLFLKMADERDIAIPKGCDGGNRSFDGKLEALLKDLNKAIAA